MVIPLDKKLEAALVEKAREKGTTPESLAVSIIKDEILAAIEIQPQDEWERGLLEAARDCGVSLSNSALSSESLYE